VKKAKLMTNEGLKDAIRREGERMGVTMTDAQVNHAMFLGELERKRRFNKYIAQPFLMLCAVAVAVLALWGVVALVKFLWNHS
jgi:hypothetical protein